MALFENYERRIAQIEKTLNEHGIASIEEAKAICDEHGIDVYNLVKSIQPICFASSIEPIPCFASSALIWSILLS